MNIHHPDSLSLLDIFLYQANLILPRLERITPDSSFAHRATGLRRTLLRLTTERPPDVERLYAALSDGFQLLEMAAKDMTKKEFSKHKMKNIE